MELGRRLATVQLLQHIAHHHLDLDLDRDDHATARGDDGSSAEEREPEVFRLCRPLFLSNELKNRLPAFCHRRLVRAVLRAGDRVERARSSGVALMSQADGDTTRDLQTTSRLAE